MEIRKHNRLKTTIIVLAVLLAVNIICLAGLWIWRQKDISGKDEISPNIITPEAEDTAQIPPDQKSIQQTDAAEPERQTEPAADTGGSAEETVKATVSGREQGRPSAGSREKSEIVLCKNHPDTNIPFSVDGMMPGDTITKEYCVEVSHDGAVEVDFDIHVQPDEKLGEVLKCSVKRMPESRVLYEGLLRDMPRKAETVSEDEKNSRLVYEITAFLDTSVGNEYQNQNLKADFIWSVPDPENLIPPQTGDDFLPAVWITVSAVSLIAVVCLLILIRKTRKENHHEK